MSKKRRLEEGEEKESKTVKIVKDVLTNMAEIEKRLKKEMRKYGISPVSMVVQYPEIRDMDNAIGNLECIDVISTTNVVNLDDIGLLGFSLLKFTKLGQMVLSKQYKIDLKDASRLRAYLDVVIGSRINFLIEARISPNFSKTLHWYYCKDNSGPYDGTLTVISEKQDDTLTNFFDSVTSANVEAYKNIFLQLLLALESSQRAAEYMHNNLNVKTVGLAYKKQKYLDMYWKYERPGGGVSYVNSRECNGLAIKIMNYSSSRMNGFDKNGMKAIPDVINVWKDTREFMSSYDMKTFACSFFAYMFDSLMILKKANETGYGSIIQMLENMIGLDNMEAHRNDIATTTDAENELDNLLSRGLSGYDKLTSKLISILNTWKDMRIKIMNDDLSERSPTDFINVYFDAEEPSSNVIDFAKYMELPMYQPKRREEQKSCTICHRISSTYCGTCEKNYCSEKCQKIDWNVGHVFSCKKYVK